MPGVTYCFYVLFVSLSLHICILSIFLPSAPLSGLFLQSIINHNHIHCKSKRKPKFYLLKVASMEGTRDCLAVSMDNVTKNNPLVYTLFCVFLTSYQHFSLHLFTLKHKEVGWDLAWICIHYINFDSLVSSFNLSRPYFPESFSHSIHFIPTRVPPLMFLLWNHVLFPCDIQTSAKGVSSLQ